MIDVAMEKHIKKILNYFTEKEEEGYKSKGRPVGHIWESALVLRNILNLTIYTVCIIEENRIIESHSFVDFEEAERWAERLRIDVEDYDQHVSVISGPLIHIKKK